jgi:decaprenylphospho-beta-D-ribofuranose 2-oxidase
MAAIGPIGADGTVVVEAGVTIHQLLERCIPEGWFVPVTPGTRAVSIGGAVAADIHGKNHHRDGTFGSHVRWLDLVVADGSTVRTGPDQEAELFWATIGGLGLTGVVSRMCLGLVPIETSTVLVDTHRLDRLDDLVEAMVAADATAPYSVAWVDCLGRHRGRSVLTTGRFARRHEADPDRRAPRGRTLPVPPLGRHSLLRSSTVAAFNAAWFHAAPRRRLGEAQSIARFFHPLDGLADWPRLYGRHGFCQWQFAVPDDAVELVSVAIDALTAARVPTFLAVLKRFGPANPGPLSFPIAGWTLAVDIPARAVGVDAVLDQLDARVAEAGGRIYLAKDARLDPRHVPIMYPRLDEWRAVRERVDPQRRFVSDMAQRLHLLDSDLSQARSDGATDSATSVTLPHEPRSCRRRRVVVMVSRGVDLPSSRTARGGPLTVTHPGVTQLLSELASGPAASPAAGEPEGRFHPRARTQQLH